MEDKKENPNYSYNKITDYEINKKNPFIGATILHIEEESKTIYLSNGNPDLIISSEGEVKGHSLMAVKRRVDKAQFIKVYYSAFKDLYDLSKSAFRIFGYISEHTKGMPNKDTLIIDFEHCKETTGYSRKTISSSLSELLGKKFIARGSNPYIYYLNPTIFFNGDRLTLLQQYILDDSKEPQKLD